MTTTNATNQNFQAEVLDFKVDPLQKAALAMVDRNSTTGTGSELIWIPLDGRPSFKITSPGYAKAHVNQFSFLGDERHVLFDASQFRPYENNIYQWVAPLKKTF